MAAPDRTGPALGQDVLVYQGAPATYRVPITNPDGTRPDLSGASAVWWVGLKPLLRGVQAGSSVANTPGAVSKPLPVVSDGAGGYQVALPIAPGDLAGLDPTGIYQHEIWITEPGRDPYPATIGALVIRGTVKVAAPPVLRALQLDATTAMAGVPFSAVIGGSAAGASLTATADDGTPLAIIGSAVTGTFTTVGAKIVTLTEVLAGAVGSPNATRIVVQVNPKGQAGSALTTIPVSLDQDGQTAILYPVQRPPVVPSTVHLVVNGEEYFPPDITVGDAGIVWANPAFALERSDRLILRYT